MFAFPTHVGVNRPCWRLAGDASGIPHARGGEPSDATVTDVRGHAFPTHVGVNRQCPPIALAELLHSPRTWG